MKSRIHKMQLNSRLPSILETIYYDRNQKKEDWACPKCVRKVMECIKAVIDGKYEVNDEAYHTLKCMVKNCEKLIKAYEKKLGQREKERKKSLNR